MAVAAVAVFAAACDLIPSDDGPLAQATPPVEKSVAASTEDTATAPPPAPEPQPTGTLRPSLPEARVTAVPETFPDPGELLGLDRDAVSALLGRPELLRRDPPAELWQYQDTACILDLFLYQRQGGGAYTVAHFEVRGRSVVRVSAKDCLRALFRARHHKQAG